jgi:maltokinase
VTDPIEDRDLRAAIAEFVSTARWFGGKGRDFTVTDVRRLGVVGADPAVLLDVVEVAYADSGDVELYQLPLALYPESQERLHHALVTIQDVEGFGPSHVYDALHDREAMSHLLHGFVGFRDVAGAPPQPTEGGLVFHRLPGHDLDLEARSTLFSGEQSNSTVMFGTDSLLKVFRKVTPGVNPDVAVHEVLTRAGSEHVAALYGWIDQRAEGQEPLQLAMLQEFLRTASDGWDLALTSVRNLFSEADLHADEVGGDFAGEAARLGTALAEVHLALAEHFPTTTRTADEMADLGAAMTRRLDAAVAVAPELTAYADALRVTFDDVAHLGATPVQQIHGDLHLGQTLRTANGWKIVDFEGEPAKPLVERVLPDSPWRDVAGMLRSFDYAPRVAAATFGEADEATEQRAFRAAEWSARNCGAFLDAYAGRPLTDAEQALLDAYVADKAVYEVVYEARNRPKWVPIPMAALHRLIVGSTA